MRTTALWTISTVLIFAVFGNSQTQSAYPCLSEAVRAVKLGDTLRVFTKDNGLVCGIHPLLVDGASKLMLLSVDDSTNFTNVLLPGDSITRLTYVRRGHGRGILTLTGLIVGGLIGGTVGGGMASESSGGGTFGLDFSGAGATISGAVVGGLLGAIGGHALGSNLASTVVFSCDR